VDVGDRRSNHGFDLHGGRCLLGARRGERGFLPRAGGGHQDRNDERQESVHRRASVHQRGIGRQCSSGVLERGGGKPVVVDGRQTARPRGGESRLTPQQLGDGGQAGLVAFLDDAVRLFRFGRSSGGDFNSLRGCLQIQVRLPYLQVNRRIGAPPEGL